MMVTKASTNSKYYEIKENKINFCLDNLSIDCDPFGTFAMVPTSEDMNGVTAFTSYYCVDICEPVTARPYAERCTCKGNREHGYYCIHMIAVDRMFAKTDMSKGSRQPIGPDPVAVALQGKAVSYFLATIISAQLAHKPTPAAPKQLASSPAGPKQQKRKATGKRAVPQEKHPLVNKFAEELRKLKKRE